MNPEENTAPEGEEKKEEATPAEGEATEASTENGEAAA